MTDQNFTAVHISWLSRGFCARFHAAVALQVFMRHRFGVKCNVATRCLR